jgi:glycine cleavage system regulatory protein
MAEGKRGRKKAVTTVITDLIADPESGITTLQEALLHPSVLGDLQGAFDAAEGRKRVFEAQAELDANVEVDLDDILANLENICHKHNVRLLISVKPVVDGTQVSWHPKITTASEEEDAIEEAEEASDVE